MKAVQLTLDDELIREVDQLAKELGTSRSSFTRDALRQAVKQSRVREAEAKWIEGYKRQPPSSDEINSLMNEQVWPEMSKQEARTWNAAKSGGTRSKVPTKRARSSSSRAT